MTELVDIPAIIPGTPVPLADGVWRLSLPMRANPGHVHSYLLAADDGLTIVDTGHNTDETRALWTPVLAGPLAAAGVRAVVLTHAHPDHAGNAAWLARETGAPVWLADAEHDALHRLWRGSITQGDAVRAFFHRRGIPEDQCWNILGMLKFFRHGCPALDEVPTRTLADGATVAAGGRAWRVVYGYGHTPANAALFDAASGLLISGDQVLPTIYPNISVWWGWIDNPLRDHLASLQQHAALPATLVLPSHGPLFRGLAARCDAIRRFHRRRLQRALAFCAEQPRTPYESIAAVVNKPSTGPVIALIAGQVLATFAFLEGEGLLACVDDHPLRYRAVPGAQERLAASPLLAGLDAEMVDTVDTEPDSADAH